VASSVTRLALTEAILRECLGHLPEYDDGNTPQLRFGYAGTNFDDLGASIVPPEHRANVTRQLFEAYTWCAHRFPLSIASAAGTRPSIVELIVAHSRHENEVLSASSAQAPGVVFMAADWPLHSPYRLASLIAHESIHQALFVREQEASPIRSRSSGYSPWKKTLRPGRLVWHAFWTFTCQSAMLGETLTSDRSLLDNDPDLPGFLTDMEARISVCLQSLELFEIVSSAEMERCTSAFARLGDLFRDLASMPGIQQLRTHAGEAAFAEYERWAVDLLAAKP
jgi:hypothetical protein